MKLEYIAINKHGDKRKFYAYGKWSCEKDNNKYSPKDWIVTHLDLSENWSYKPTGNFKHGMKVKTIEGLK